GTVRSPTIRPRLPRRLPATVNATHTTGPESAALARSRAPALKARVQRVFVRSLPEESRRGCSVRDARLRNARLLLSTSSLPSPSLPSSTVGAATLLDAATGFI